MNRIQNMARPVRTSGLDIAGFWLKVDGGEDDECWNCKGAIDWDGYGRVSCGDRILLVHRVAYVLEVGLIPAGLQLDHLCRNRSCVNPRHLEPVTSAENTRRGLASRCLNGS